MAAIKALVNELDQQAARSVHAQQLETIPGFGPVCSAELAGAIGTLQRFGKPCSLAFYLGMAPLDNHSGAYRGSKPPRHVNTLARKAKP
ncbi:MAG: transposase [Methylococcales bacterium]